MLNNIVRIYISNQVDLTSSHSYCQAKGAMVKVLTRDIMTRLNIMSQLLPLQFWSRISVPAKGAKVKVLTRDIMTRFNLVEICSTQ